MSSKQRVLVVDDEAFVRDSLAEILRSSGFDVSTAPGAGPATELLGTERIDAVVCDLRMPDGDGLDLLRRADGVVGSTPFIVLTGVGTVTDAVEAMKAGAFDFLLKPVEPEHLVQLVRRAIEHHRLRSEVDYLRETVRDLRGSSSLLGSSGAMEQIRGLIEQVAATDSTVLVTGESGVGKELVADEIHRRSARSDHILVRVNCAAVPDSLFESEFFGHRRGAFSGAVSDRQGRFAEAEGGTLVLDEIGTLQADIQAKLLRVLESGEYQVVGESRTRVADVRIVAMTNEVLSVSVAEGSFRSDLFYRLNVFPIEMPPLREHLEDIPLIASAFLAERLGERAAELADAAVEVLSSYAWPGNVRELRNVLERALILAGEALPGAALLAGILETPMPSADALQGPLHLRSNLDATERRLVQQALERSKGKKKEAAESLGIDPRNLGYYLRKHGLVQ